MLSRGVHSVERPAIVISIYRPPGGCGGSPLPRLRAINAATAVSSPWLAVLVKGGAVGGNSSLPRPVPPPTAAGVVTAAATGPKYSGDREKTRLLLQSCSSSSWHRTVAVAIVEGDE